MNAYEFDSVSKCFEGEMVLNELNVKGRSESFLCVVGKSGVGKSTFLRMLGGFELPDHGGIFIAGEGVNKPQKKCPMVFQSYEQLFPWLPIWENVAFPLRVNGENRASRKAKALEALEAVGLKEDAKKFPHQLSGGMKQRAALARAWIAEPKLLLMDEPFGGLDMLTREALQSLLIALWKEKKWTVVFITHDLREAARLSTDLLILKEEGEWEWMENQLLWPRDPYSRDLNDWICKIQL